MQEALRARVGSSATLVAWRMRWFGRRTLGEWMAPDLNQPPDRGHASSTACKAYYIDVKQDEEFVDLPTPGPSKKTPSLARVTYSALKKFPLTWEPSRTSAPTHAGCRRDVPHRFERTPQGFPLCRMRCTDYMVLGATHRSLPCLDAGAGQA